ncbi:protein saal1 isoform X2 [Nilaparvata lugens]|uniref:protein saal1 isoform X1 n=1 Tax=Nilaparvata lugens TaxID=108931 RepID=UPI00193CABCE|nr:protein saal1 isoform X1 [Nilaparvata lugens]XP_039290954.1 protein saal1 isoform X2 [Nilaparvata lugens]
MSTNTVSPRNETNNEGGGDEKEIDEGGGGEGEDEKEMDDGEGEVKSQVQNVSTDYCNPQLPEDITEDVGDKLRGDAIGDTLYSERFVLLVLMKLIKNIEKVEWSEEFETEMCSLWDMTIEKDVVLFLLKHDFIKLATCLLQLPDLEPRFLEIIVGILHNMCCVEEVRKELCEMPETTSCLMDTLSSNDSLTLVQAVRLLNTVAWDVVHQVEERDPSPHWLARAVDDLQLSSRLAYILLSSTRPDYSAAPSIS